MKHQLKIIFILCVLLVSVSFSQKHLEMLPDAIEQGVSFQDFIEQVENYYRDKDKGKGSGYKHFRRWVFRYENYVGENGKIPNLNKEVWNDFYKRNPIGENSFRQERSLDIFKGNWESMGPTDSQSSFSNTTPYGNGRLDCVTIDPDNPEIIYVGAPESGVWRTNIGGGKWENLHDNMPQFGVNNILIDHESPVNNRTIYIGANGYQQLGGVKVSYDNGTSWHSTGFSDGVRKLIMNPDDSKEIFVANNSGIYKTQNGGLSWSIKQVGNISDIVYHPVNSNILYASIDSKFYRSINRGETWQALGFEVPTGGFFIAVTKAAVDNVYLLRAGGSVDGLYISHDRGVSFEQKKTFNKEYGAIAVSPDDPNIIYMGLVRLKQYKINDSGDVSPVGHRSYVHADHRDLKFYGNTLYSANDGGINKMENPDENWRTLNENWVNLSSGLDIMQFYHIDISRSGDFFVAGGALHNGTNKVENKKAIHTSGGDGFDIAIHPENSNIIFSSSQGNMYRSLDGGETNRVVTNLDDATGDNWHLTNGGHLMFFSQHEPYTFYTVREKISKSTDNGETWTSSNNAFSNGGTIMSFAQSPANEDRFIAAGVPGPNPFFSKSIDGGETWIPLANKVVREILFHPTDENIAWLATSGSIFKTTDFGDTWVDITYNLQKGSGVKLAYDKDRNVLYLAGSYGVYSIEENEANWVDFNDNLPVSPVFDIHIDYPRNRLIVATFGRGLWVSDLKGSINCEETLLLSDDITDDRLFQAKNIISSSKISSNAQVTYRSTEMILLDIGTEISASVPFCAEITPIPCSNSVSFRAKNVERTGYYAGPMEGLTEYNEVLALESENENFEFLMVHPNPVSNQGNIDFKVFEESNVSIMVTDILGNLVSMVVDQQSYTSGDYRVNFEMGSYPNGVYLVNLETNNNLITKRIIVNK